MERTIIAIIDQYTVDARSNSLLSYHEESGSCPLQTGALLRGKTARTAQTQGCAVAQERLRHRVLYRRQNTQFIVVARTYLCYGSRPAAFAVRRRRFICVTDSGTDRRIKEYPLYITENKRKIVHNLLCIEVKDWKGAEESIFFIVRGGGGLVVVLLGPLGTG